MSNDGEVIETSADGMWRVVLHRDLDPINPREDGDLSMMGYAVTVHDSRYYDVPYPGPWSDQWEWTLHHHGGPRYGSGGRDAMEVFERFVRIHGGVTERYTPHDGPDAVFYYTPERIAELGITDPVAALKAEAAEYAAWREGDVWFYNIERIEEWQRTAFNGADPLTQHRWGLSDDSCGGLIGYDYAVEAAREAFAPYRTA